MIVHCTGCEARFRVPDEKVGPRGARIRCSRCKTLFAVGPPGGTTASTLLPTPLPPAAGPEVELETPPPAPRLEIAPDDPFAGFRLDAGPPFGPAGAATEPDVFAPHRGAPPEPRFGVDGPGMDPLAPGRTAQVGRLDAGPFDAPEPPWAGGLDGPDAGESGDDLAARSSPDAAWLDDPLAAAPSRRAGRSSGSDRSLPLTDLSDLLGDPERPPPGPPPLPSARGGGAGERGAGLDGDLALEEPAARRMPARTAEPSDPSGAPRFPGDEPGGGPSELGALAAFDEAPLALATEPATGLPEMWRDAPAHAPEPAEEAAATTAPAAPPAGRGATAATEAAAPASARPAGRGSLRSIAVNAASLAALLVLAIGFRVLWRGAAGATDTGGPAAVLRAIGLGGRPGAALETAGVTSGRYPRALGAPLLLVRGEVISRSPGPPARVRVDVELVRDGRPIAARTALAGAAPTAEELYAVKDAAALDALSAAVARRAHPVSPGVPVAFLAAFADVPDDLTGATIRVVASADR